MSTNKFTQYEYICNEYLSTACQSLHAFVTSGSVEEYDGAPYLLIATDGSVVDEKAGACSYIPHLDVPCPVRLPEFTPTYDAELLPTILVVNRIPASFTKIFIISDSSSEAVFSKKYLSSQTLYQLYSLWMLVLSHPIT